MNFLVRLLLAALLASIATGPKAATWPPQEGVVSYVIDGDTFRVGVPAWQATPFEWMGLRVIGIDTPEAAASRAKCEAELARGLEAKAYARTLLPNGARISFAWTGHDKYGGRFLASVTLPDGRDYAAVMIAAGHARPYNGGAKASWCPTGGQ